MLRSVAFVLGVFLGASRVANADTPAEQRPASDDAGKNMEFVALVQKADRAWAPLRNVETAFGGAATARNTRTRARRVGSRAT